MTSLPHRPIACIGFMGAGKSTAARELAAALGRRAIDVDEVIEDRLGKPIERVFAEDGEARFRAEEERVTLELLSSLEPDVLALGGGAVTHERVRGALADALVIWLDVPLETAWARVEGAGRPLAQERESFIRLYAERERLYASLADVVVPTERAHQLVTVLETIAGVPPGTRTLWAASDSGDYPAYIGAGLLGRFWPAAVAGRRFLVTDGNVGRLYGDALDRAAGQGRAGQGDALDPIAGRVAIMPGEQSKTVAHADIVWSELARAGMTREDVVVALGGGVVGDLAGFCAATYQRGVRFVQVPTTLVAQVDSAYGGKTGVDLPEAKNYVGAYHQPSAVLADPDTLNTLPPEELAAGYAEVVKTALIAGGWLWELVRGGGDPLAGALDPSAPGTGPSAPGSNPPLPAVVAACALTKLRVVARDERDAGVRQVLNLGHTVGHAIETVTGYARYRHGEAVALGLLAALRLSDQGELREEVARLLAAHGLPTTLDGADPDAVVMATARDKKRIGERPVPFVLLDGPGEPRTGCVIDNRALIAAVRELIA